MFNASQTWVKNVYSLWVDGVISGVYVYTPTYSTGTSLTFLSVKPSTFTPFIDSFTPRSYTSFFAQLSLLMTRLYTVSTAPTIKKMKKK